MVEIKSSVIARILISKGVSDKTGYYIVKIIVSIKDTLSKLCEELTSYRANVGDPIISIILKYKYINNFSWEKTAFKIGGGNKAASLRKRLYRYLKKRGNTHSYLTNKGDI